MTVSKESKEKPNKEHAIEVLSTSSAIALTSLFRDSPLMDGKLEGRILAEFALKAAKTGSKLEDTKLSTKDFGLEQGFREYLDEYSQLRGKPQIKTLLKVESDDTLMLSQELVDFTRGRVEKYFGDIGI